MDIQSVLSVVIGSRSMSMGKNADRRVQRTRGALRSAFVELVLTRGYEALTAADISSKANVGRSTFYLHYASKAALLKESLRNPSNQMAACVDENITAQQLIPLLEHFREQRTVNRTFFEDPIRSLWIKILAALIESRLTARTGGSRSGLPRSLAALMIAEMQIALITHWLTYRYVLKAELIAATIIANTRAMLSVSDRSQPPK
jgi:AcrR family transcriptional regulator